MRGKGMSADEPRVRWRDSLIVVAIVLLVASGCAWIGEQKTENLRADTILKQSIEESKQR
jgi:hypothetical protein